jgi:hypothetical protein
MRATNSIFSSSNLAQKATTPGKLAKPFIQKQTEK